MRQYLGCKFADISTWQPRPRWADAATMDDLYVISGETLPRLSRWFFYAAGEHVCGSRYNVYRRNGLGKAWFYFWFWLAQYTIHGNRQPRGYT